MTLLSPIHIIPARTKRAPPTWNIDNTRINTLQVILKTVERCNINCSYCYYFNGGDNSFEERPPTIEPAAIASTAAFLLQGALELGIPNVQVVFHGGEPMMQSKRRFDSMCNALRTTFEGSGVTLTFAIQTNGTLVDDEWCELLSRHAVGVGISIDGPREVNDKYRLDHKGRSTYDATVAGLECLRAFEERKGISFGLGSLTVINPEYSYRAIYRHLTETLGFKQVGFLLPDCCHDSFPAMNASPERFGEIMNDIFDAWRENPLAQVSHIERNLLFFHAASLSADMSAAPDERSGKITLANQIIVVHSDGSLSVDDSLIPASAWRNGLAKAHTGTTTLRGWLSSPFYSDIFSALRKLPSSCADCSWKNICQGGDIENRFSTADNFERRSVFCGGLDRSYGHMVDYLLANGYPTDKLLQKLS
jgi:uncharacterized protein